MDRLDKSLDELIADKAKNHKKNNKQSEKSNYHLTLYCFFLILL